MEKPEPPAAGERNRSLARGIELLRAFRPGDDLLGNGELAERTGLARPTVSRLAQTLADGGLLERDRRRRAYRLAAPVLSLAHTMRTGSPLLAAAAPPMRAEAQRLKINVGLAAADRDEMVYLESFRFGRRVEWRNVVAGQRVPIELTSLGRAWLAVAPDDVRVALLARLRAKRRGRWSALAHEISQAVEQVRRDGWCWASWQPQVVALATPIVLPDRPVVVLNMSTSGETSPAHAAARLSGPLLALRERLLAQLSPPA